MKMSLAKFGLWLIFSFYFFAGLAAQGVDRAPKIIYLKGSCSAGKSTFIRQFISRCDGVEVVDEDAIMHKRYVDAVAERFPAEMAVLSKVINRENLYHALREKDVLFKKEALKEECTKAVAMLGAIREELNKVQNLSWKQGVSKEIDLEVVHKIRSALEMNKPVLLDSWYIKPKHLQEYFPKSQVIRVMLYCPLPVAYERFLKRNKEAMQQENLQEKRYLRQLVGSFFSMYQLSMQPAKSIQQVSKKELDQVVDAIASSLKEQGSAYEKPVFTSDEVSRELFLKMKTDFLRPFEESNSEVLYIVPKEEQDIVLDSSKDDLQKVMQLISV
jgi:dephospho-CoA kinase